MDGGLVTAYAVLMGNPSDAEHLAASLAQHQARFGQPPGVLAADRSFFSLDNDRSVQAAGVRTPALPRPGPLSAERHRVEHRPAFRRAYRFRAGIEGRISLLKRQSRRQGEE